MNFVGTHMIPRKKLANFQDRTVKEMYEQAHIPVIGRR